VESRVSKFNDILATTFAFTTADLRNGLEKFAVVSNSKRKSRLSLIKFVDWNKKLTEAELTIANADGNKFLVALLGINVVKTVALLSLLVSAMVLVGSNVTVKVF
jgi:hypothetical protein